MKRHVKALGEFAVAASAATALLVFASRSARPQELAIPSRQDTAKVDLDEITRKKIARQMAAQAVIDAEATAVRRVALGPGFGVNAANRDEAIRVGIQKLRPTLWMELRLLAEAAEPTPGQRREIAIEAGRTLKVHIEHLANNQFNKPARMVSALYNPRKLVHQHLELAAWPRLSNVQSARYLAEQERKEQARREVVVLNVVANLDRHLSLDAGQREKLCEALLSGWDDRDYAVLETSLAYATNAPINADQYILPILTEDQQKVWRSLRRVIFTNIGGTNPLNNLMAIDLEDVVDDEDVKIALGVEVKK